MDTHPDMREQIISADRCSGSGQNPGKHIERVARRYEQHDQICHEENQRAAKILRDDEDQHMKRREHCRNHDAPEIPRVRQQTGNRKHKNNFDKLGRLNRNKAEVKRQLGAVRRAGHDRHKRKQADTREYIQPVHFRDKPELADEQRNQQRHSRRDHRYLELLDALRIGQPRDHDHPDADQHTHIVDQQARGQRVEIAEQDQHSRKIQDLRGVKQQDRRLRHLQVQHRERDKMHTEHQHILAQKQILPRFIVLFIENGITLEGIQRHQHNNQIF